MPPRIARVHIRNYKSIAQADVYLDSLTVFVGPNGSGKSNFIDALAFVQNSMSGSLQNALGGDRGGVGAVLCRSNAGARRMGFRFELERDGDFAADYGFEIEVEDNGSFRVARERCVARQLSGPPYSFEVRDGQFFAERPFGVHPTLEPDSLALPLVSATPWFRDLYDVLRNMRFYSIAPREVRKLQDLASDEYLSNEGDNAAAVLERLQKESGWTEVYDRICRLLRLVVPGVRKIESQPMGIKQTIQFSLDVGSDGPMTMEAHNMSDGTLRVLGLLLAAYQPGHVSVLGIEEPEATVHPGAAEVIMQVLLDAAHDRQVLITTHSPDLLDYKELRDEQIRVVVLENGKTIIAPISQSGRQAIRDRLFTPGELLRSDELLPDLEAAKSAAPQTGLFE